MKAKELHKRKRLKKHAWTSLVYLVVASLSLIGSITAWGNAKADETIMVAARVGDVVAGPTIVTETAPKDDKDEKGTDEGVPASLATKPMVSIEPSAGDGAVFSYITDQDTGKAIPQFTTEKPVFQGETNIKDAAIKLAFQYGEFRLHSATQADAAGKWHWRSPEPFPNGSFHVDITAENPRVPEVQTVASIDFLVQSDKKIPAWKDVYKADASSALFDVVVSIPERFQTIAPGDELVANIKLINFGTPGTLIDTEVEYLIVNEAGKIVTQNKETLAVSTQLSFLKSFYTQPNLKDGKYELIVRVPSRNLLAIGSSSFAVSGAGNIAIGPVGKIDYTVVFQTLLGAVFLFILLAYFEFMRFLALKKSIESVRDKSFKSFLT